MTQSDRVLLIRKCSQILHEALTEIRDLAYQNDELERIGDLADLTHNIPLFMVGRHDLLPDHLRIEFMAYARKYHPDIDPEKSRYVMLLDMDEATCHDLHRRISWPWPETATAAS